MALPVDTNTLLRSVRHIRIFPVSKGPLRECAAITSSWRSRPENLIEFWVVATRPQDDNGLDMGPPAAARTDNARGTVRPPAGIRRASLRSGSGLSPVNAPSFDPPRRMARPHASRQGARVPQAPGDGRDRARRAKRQIRKDARKMYFGGEAAFSSVVFTSKAEAHRC
jgi:hypothetical protein